jgi:glutamyl-tRNA synthetase
MHVGNLLSGLLAWLSARSQGGEFVIRLEQLDERCKDEYALQVLDDLAWLGIDWDEEPFVQKASDKEGFDEAFETLASVGRVYPCFCSRADLHAASAPHASGGTVLYAGTCRGLDSQQVALKDAEIRKRTGHGPAWRLEVPDTDIVFEDAVKASKGTTLCAIPGISSCAEAMGCTPTSSP